MYRHLESTRRVEQLLLTATRAEIEDLARSLAALAYERGLWREVQGHKRQLAFALRPWILSADERRRVHELAWHVRMALGRLSLLAAERPAFHQIVPLDPRERDWVERYRGPDLPERRGEHIFCRLDALFRRSEGSPLGVQWLEPNVVGIAGLSYSAAIETATCEVLLPWLRERDPGVTLERGYDGRRLLFDELCEHAAELGVTGRLPNVALVDDLAQYTYGGELARLRDYFATQGMKAVLIAPEALRAERDGRLIAAGTEIDLVYRFLELPELIAIEESGKDLSGLRRSFEQGRVVPSIGGDFEHKSVLEIFSRPDFLAEFPPEQQKTLAGSVLWTRLLRERRTEDPDGRPCELAGFCERERERLVLKPNRGFGGHGVVIGPTVDQHTWRDALSAALSKPDSFVVQEYAEVDRQELLVVDADGVHGGLHHRSAGVFPGRDNMSLFGRFASGEVVNVGQGGGIVAFMLERG